MSRHTISVLVKNEFGVLVRVSGLFSARGFNIASLSVAETVDPHYSRITIVTSGSEEILTQIIKQLQKLIPVIKVVDLTEEKSLIRELILTKVNARPKDRTEILQIVSLFNGKVLDGDEHALTLEFVGDESQISTIVSLLEPFGVRELTRSGHVATPKLSNLPESTELKSALQSGRGGNGKRRAKNARGQELR